jgi:hypothetical protein
MRGFVLGLIVLNCLATFTVQAQTNDICEGIQECVSLLDHVNLNALTSLSSGFVRPQIAVDVRISSASAENPYRLYVRNSDYTGLRTIEPENPRQCELVVADVENELGQPSAYIDINTSINTTLRLYTYCLEINLPNHPLDVIDPGFPGGVFAAAGFPPLEDSQIITTVLRNAAKGDCLADAEAEVPESWNYLAVQFAIFLAVNDTVPDMSMWELFSQRMQNPIFQHLYASIYCLLGQDAPQPDAALILNQTIGDDPFLLEMSNASTGDIAGYAIEVVNAAGTPFFAATAESFPAGNALVLNKGEYQARLVVYGPSQSYLNGAFVEQPVSTESVSIFVTPPAHERAAALPSTATPTATPTPIPPVDRLLQDTPFPVAPNLYVRDALLMFAGGIALLTLGTVFFAGVGLARLHQNRVRLALILMIGGGLALILIYNFWSRMPDVTDAAEMSTLALSSPVEETMETNP